MLFLLQISMRYLKIILFALTYSNKLSAKTNNFFQTQSDISIGIVSKGLRDIEDVCPSSKFLTSRNRIFWTKKAYEIDSVTSTWNMGALIFNWNDFMNRKKYWRPSFLFNLLPTALKVTWIFCFGGIYLGIHSIWTLSLLLWMKLWLNILRFVCGFPHFLISWTLMK